jgi:hypothetical protein
MFCLKKVMTINTRYLDNLAQVETWSSLLHQERRNLTSFLASTSIHQKGITSGFTITGSISDPHLATIQNVVVTRLGGSGSHTYYTPCLNTYVQQ